MTDAITLASAELSDALRVWLRRREERDDVLAGALAYELTALIAKHATTEAQACELLEVWLAEMKNQIRVCGVGVEHP